MFKKRFFALAFFGRVFHALKRVLSHVKTRFNGTFLETRAIKLISTNRIILKLNTQNKLCIHLFTLKMPNFELKGS